jgi:ribonuclease Z
MSERSLTVLGTASPVPTRTRNHNGYLLRWDDHGLLFDPGEGTQRQMTMAGVSFFAITKILITHFHGDHCLGLPGLVQRLSLLNVPHPVEIHYPAYGQPFVERLIEAASFHNNATLVLRPFAQPGVICQEPGFTITARPLHHRIETWGYRLQEPDGVTLLPDRLAALGVKGPAIGQLKARGSIELDGRTVDVVEVSIPRPGQSMAFVMDTSPCQAALDLAAGVDLLVCEATFLSDLDELAVDRGHLTAARAAELAAQADVGQLVMGHISERYGSLTPHEQEAQAIFPRSAAGRDLSRYEIPRRERAR